MQADRTTELRQLLAERILILDGAMGTMIQRYKLGEADYRRVFDAGLGWCLSDIREDLLQFGVRHDNFFSERSLMTDGFVQRAIDTLRANPASHPKASIP